MLLNVNGMKNPIKRGKVLTKFRKEEIHVILLQETHLSTQEHEKLERYGYNNTFYAKNSKQSNKRGLVTLIRNAVIYLDIYDREGRYVVVKGKMEGQMVTLTNVCAPPDSEKTFFETV